MYVTGSWWENEEQHCTLHTQYGKQTHEDSVRVNRPGAFLERRQYLFNADPSFFSGNNESSQQVFPFTLSTASLASVVEMVASIAEKLPHGQ